VSCRSCAACRRTRRSSSYSAPPTQPAAPATASLPRLSRRRSSPRYRPDRVRDTDSKEVSPASQHDRPFLRRLVLRLSRPGFRQHGTRRGIFGGCDGSRPKRKRGRAHSPTQPSGGPSLCADCSSSNGGCPPLRTARTAPAAATDTARRSVLKRIAKALDVDVTELLK
jgi:hypothetical protein